MVKWTTANIPSQKDRLAVVTGTGGIGYEVALALAKASAKVIIAGRDFRKGKEAVAKIRAQYSAADINFEIIDLADMASIDDFSKRMVEQFDHLDILVNNAAVMNPPNRLETKDGFELQFGTNYLSHFYLTELLLPLLTKKPGSRVVTVSSVANRSGHIDFEDLQSQLAYVPMKAYSQSKLAGLMFALELQRKSQGENWGISSFAAHPGISRTDLLHNAPGKRSPAGLARSVLWFLFQPASQGALPVLYAATAPQAKGGCYFGPTGLGETRGYPGLAKIPPQALDRDKSQRLWTESERLTGRVYVN